MADLRIADAPELSAAEVQDGLKVPTGGFGNYAVTFLTIRDWLINFKGLVTQSQLSLKADQATTYTKNETDGALSTKANASDVYQKTETYNKAEVDTKVGVVSGGYFKAFDTLANLQAATGMTTGQVAKVMNDPTATNNGDYRYTGTAWVKGYDALTDAKSYADSQDLTVKSELKEYTLNHSLLSQEISLHLVKKEPEISSPAFGSVSPATSYNNASAGTYVLATPAQTQVTIHRFKTISGVSSGNFELRVYSRSGDTFTLVKVAATLNIKQAGLNEYNISDFEPFKVEAGQYLAACILTGATTVYSGSSTTDVYYSSTYLGLSPFVGTAGQFNLKFAFYTTTGSDRANLFIDNVEQISNQSEVYFENILSGYSANKGLVATPSVKTGTNNGAGHMCIGSPISGFGTVSNLEVYSANGGSAQVGVYTRNGTAFTRKRFVSVTLASGYNSIPVSLSISNGEYVGLRTTIVGQVEYENSSVGHENMYVSSGAITDDSFNVSSTTPISQFAYQLRFTISYKTLATGINSKKWQGLNYVSFGDSITWYNGRAFASSHLESGQLAKGYQSYVVDELGCTLDNKGESGWTMPRIFNERINVYDFTNTYLTTITSGANDQRTGVAVGTIQPIGGTFNTATYAGAMQAAIEKVINSNKATKIVLITPIRGWYNEYNTSNVPNPDPTTVGVLKREYPDMVKEIGKLYGLPVIDFYDNCELNDLNKNYFLGDNPAVFTAYLLHPMNRFFQRMGEIAVSTLRNL